MQHILRNWKTSLAGLGSILSGFGLIGPELVSLSRGEIPNVLNLKAGAAAVAVGFGLLFAKDGDKTGTGAKPSVSIVPPAAAALLVGGALLFAAPARAQDATPSAPFHTIDLGKGYSLSPIAGMSGTAYDIAHNSAARSYQFGLGLEIRKDGVPIGFAACGNGQFGDIIAGSASGVFTLADPMFGLFKDFGAGFNFALVSRVASYGPTVVRVFRF